MTDDDDLAEHVECRECGQPIPCPPGHDADDMRRMGFDVCARCEVFGDVEEEAND